MSSQQAPIGGAPLMDLTLVAVVGLALFFDFTNGFHDAANAIATTVSTRALTPRTAVLMAGVLNFAGAFISIKVATTVGKGIVDPHVVTINVVLAGVVGAIVWNLVTWALGLPSSSSHALIGGVAGAGIAAGGFAAVQWAGVTEKILLPSLISIFAGIAGAVLGAGAARKFSAVRWGIVRSILAAWLFTLPAAGLVAAAMFALTRIPGGSVVVFAIAVLFSAAVFFLARTRAQVTPPRAAEQLHPAVPPAT